MRRRAASIAIGLAAACFALLAYVFLTLPDVRPLATRNPATTAFIELRAREAADQGRKPRRVQRWVRYEAVSANLRKAVLVAEDDAFWTHDGVDVEQLKESFEANLEKGKAARGGSTITQQLAKNLYLSPSKNPVRKVREFLIARALEAELTKQRILELYLNEIEWGDGIYGAEAAARTYFRKSCADLSPQEASLLAAAIANPRLLDPGHPSTRLRRRQQMVMHRMGAVTPPPVVAGPPIPPPATVEPGIQTVPALPDAVGAPTALPGEPVPVPRGPGGKPPDGGD